MVDRASVFNQVQVGVETTAGMAVPANRRLQSMSIDPTITPSIKVFGPSGQLFDTVAALDMEHVEAGIEGMPVYDEIVYPLSSLIKSVTPTLDTVTAQLWTFSPSLATNDTVRTFTVEQGSPVRAHRFTYGLVTAMNVDFARNGLSIGGSMVGKALEDGITLTASPTALPLIPVTGAQWQVWLATPAASPTWGTALARVLSASWALEERHSLIWVGNGSTSFAGHVTSRPTLRVTLRLAADATGMGLLTNMRAGDTRLVRISASGANIEAGKPYLMQFDTAGKITNVSKFSDQDGLYAIEWTFSGVWDSTWGRATEVQVRNTLAAL